MEFSLYQSTGGRWGRLFLSCAAKKIPSAMLNPRGLLGDVLGTCFTISPCSIFHVWQVEKKSYTYKTYRSLTDGSGTDFPSFVQFSRLVTELFWSFSDLMHISLCFLSRKQGSVKCLTNKKLMATVKTVLVKRKEQPVRQIPVSRTGSSQAKEKGCLYRIQHPGYPV